MNLECKACVDFEHDLHAFVDHELRDDELPRVVAHLDQCPSCRGYLDDLEELAGLNHEATAEFEASVAAVVDKHELFADITKSLLSSRRQELVRLFHELGNAYLDVANRAIKRAHEETGKRREKGKTHRAMLYLTPPRSIRSTTSKARRLARECEDLESQLGRRVSKSGSLFGRRTRMFDGNGGPGAGAMASARHFIEQALSLDEQCLDARMKLGELHMLSGRYDRARHEFKGVIARAGDDVVAAMKAMHWLGMVYAALGHEHASRAHYLSAIECYETIVASRVVDRDARFFASLLNLAVNCAKIGLQSRSVKHFTQLVERHPEKIEHSRKLLRGMEDFRVLLDARSQLRDDLHTCVPALFAA